LPGFRPGKIPPALLEQRYGARARHAVKENFAVQAAHQLLAEGNLTSATESRDNPGNGDLLLRLTVTHLPDLKDPQFDSVVLTRLTAEDPKLAPLLEAAFREQVLDQLDAAYHFTLAPVLVNKELVAIRAAASAQLALISEEERRGVDAELLTIAERRVRVGAVVLEIARRFGISVTPAEAQAARRGSETQAQAHGRLTEERVIAHLTAMATVTERPATPEELEALAG
jgi:FKBP-type peptidyl-prolyl cis-trans isomerase (trigger factor)